MGDDSKIDLNKFPPKAWSQNNNNNNNWMRCFTMWGDGTEVEWWPASILQYITSWYFHLDHELSREALPCSTYKLSNNMYIVQKVIYIGMFPNTNMPTDIGPCSDEDLYVSSSYIDVYKNPEIEARMDETRSGVLLSHSLNCSSTILSMWIYDL